MRYGMKVWATNETWKSAYIIGRRTNCRTFEQGKQFQIGTFKIKAFPVHHKNIDGTECENSGFLIYSNVTKEKLLWITDASYIESKFPPVDYICVECNYIDTEYDGDLLECVNPFVEKRRFGSHLSLQNCIKFLQSMDLSNVKWIKILHMSKSQGNIQKKILKELKNNFQSVEILV